MKKPSNSLVDDTFWGEKFTFDFIRSQMNPKNECNVKYEIVTLVEFPPKNRSACVFKILFYAYKISTFLTLKAPITTAWDDKFCEIFPNFRKK